MNPFSIDTMTTTLHADPTESRRHFERDSVLNFAQPFAPDLLRILMMRAAGAEFVPNDVVRIGTREVEAPQRVGGMINLMLARPGFLQWVEQATGLSPLRAVAGRLVQTCANGKDALVWHDDLDGPNRLLGIVINLSDAPFSGGDFEMRRVGADRPFLTQSVGQPGSMRLFALGSDLQHRVTKLTSGGPRRVYSGWFLSEPEHEANYTTDKS